MMFLYVAIITALWANSACSSYINCKENNCTEKGLQHPLCTYPDPSPSPACGKVQSLGFTYAEKENIIAAYNNYRSYVAQGYEARGNPGPQPPAADMQMMLWDYDLAQAAQRWVNQCSNSKAPCVDEERFEVEQSRAETKVKDLNNIKPSDLIKHFYDQVEYLDRSIVLAYKENSTYNAYTQLVWANTNRVGCGKIIYGEDNDDWLTYILLCLYGPKGNEDGKPVYKVSRF